MNKWKATIGVVLLFTVGALFGSIGTGMYIKNRHVQLREKPTAKAAFIVDRLTRKLRLTSDQQAQVERIVQKHQIQIATLRLTHRAQVRHILDQIMTEIQTILTPDQQRKMEPILNKLEKKRRQHLKRFGNYRH